MGTLIEAAIGLGNQPAELNANPTLRAPEPREWFLMKRSCCVHCDRMNARPGDAAVR